MRRFLRVMLLAFSITGNACAEHTVTRVTVVNEEGGPIEGATAGVVYYSRTPSTNPGDHGEGLTDANGMFVFTGRAYWLGQVGTTKEGYYSSARDLEVTAPDERGYAQVKQEIDVTLTLREIRNPVPMYAGAVSTRIPEFREAVGFDLQRMDWVSPDGEGQKADVFFTLSGDFVDADEFDMRLSLWFPGEGNGIIVQDGPAFPESAFKSPYEAPLEGYRNEWVLGMRRLGLQRARQQNKEDYFEMERNESRVYVFRVRSQIDANSEVIGGHYGKIYGDFDFGVPIDRPAYLMGFTIYFNPEEENGNLEFDPNRNLSEQRIAAP